MEERKLESWADFRMVVGEIREKYGYHEYTIGSDCTVKEKNTVLFRGQQCAEWPLKTTLERKIDKPVTVNQYILIATKIVHEIESHTKTNWEVPEYPILQKQLANKGDEMFGPYLDPNLYRYLVYLRHHGYPSPLLDWSESPYIAAYFAMFELDQHGLSPDQRIAIFAYVDRVGSLKTFDGGPVIQVKGPYVSTDKRHFMQKAWYTVAAKKQKGVYQHLFCSHHEIFDKPQPNQDILIKITLPITERKLALKELDDYNINHFTLFQTEDSLIRALSIREFDMGEV